MTGNRRCALLALPGPALGRSPQPAIRDAVRYFDPALVAVPGPRDPQAHAAVRDAFPDGPVMHPQLARHGNRVTHYRHRPASGVGDTTEIPPADDALDILAVQDRQCLDRLATQAETGERQTGRGAATYLLVPRLSVEWDATTLSTELPGRAHLARLGAVLPEPVTVLAGGQPADYSHEWTLSHDGSPVTVRMAGLGATGAGGATFAQLTCTPRGTVAAEIVDTDQFGLTSLTGVGPATARRLRERGCRTTDDVRDIAVSDLADVTGIGRTTAEQVHAHAEVIASGEPLVLTNKRPVTTRDDRPPLCLDIETDGLTPTILWQFGVYDPATDDYRAFIEDENPDDPGSVLGSFITWFLARHADRTVLTWNGDGFDYPQIEQFLRQHHPEYLDPWQEVWTDDLYTWAVREENALLPGRTNKLDHVARALGHDGAGTGLTGAQTAAAYQRFMRDPGAELDWERHRAYCEDDCRALWHVYEAIVDADRRDVTDSGSGGARGRQAGLTDF